MGLEAVVTTAHLSLHVPGRDTHCCPAQNPFVDLIRPSIYHPAIVFIHPHACATLGQPNQLLYPADPVTRLLLSTIVAYCSVSSSSAVKAVSHRTSQYLLSSSDDPHDNRFGSSSVCSMFRSHCKNMVIVSSTCLYPPCLFKRSSTRTPSACFDFWLPEFLANYFWWSASCNNTKSGRRSEYKVPQSTRQTTLKK